MVKKGLPAPTSFAAGATQFTCFTSTKVKILTQKKRPPAPTSYAAEVRQEFGVALTVLSLLYSEKKNGYREKKWCRGATDSTQFTCFTSKQVQILTFEELQR